MNAHTPGPHTVIYAEHLGDPSFAVKAADGDLIAVGCLQVDAFLFAASTMLLEAADDAVKAFRLLRLAMDHAGDAAAVEMIDQHVHELEYAIDRATGVQS